MCKLGARNIASAVAMATRRFREATGATFIKWLNAERVARARQLLETTAIFIECVASQVGFGTTLSLRQQFADQLGTTPTEYRRNFRTVGS